MTPPKNGPKLSAFEILTRGSPMLVALLALVLVLWSKFDAGARADPYSGTQGRANQALSAEKFTNMRQILEQTARNVDKLTAAVALHAARDMHEGARLKFAEIAGELRHITSEQKEQGADIKAIRAKLEGD